MISEFALTLRFLCHEDTPTGFEIEDINVGIFALVWTVHEISVAASVLHVHHRRRGEISLLFNLSLTLFIIVTFYDFKNYMVE